MTPQKLTTVKKIGAGLAVALTMFLITVVFTTQNKVAALEVKVEAAEREDAEIKATLETMRRENNDAHQRILDLLSGRGK